MIDGQRIHPTHVMRLVAPGLDDETQHCVKCRAEGGDATLAIACLPKFTQAIESTFDLGESKEARRERINNELGLPPHDAEQVIRDSLKLTPEQQTEMTMQILRKASDVDPQFKELINQLTSTPKEVEEALDTLARTGSCEIPLPDGRSATIYGGKVPPSGHGSEARAREVECLGQCVEMLNQLDKAGAGRVARYLSARYV